MNKKKKCDSTEIETAVVLIVSIAAYLFLGTAAEQDAKTLIGTAGLLAAKQQIIRYLVFRFLRITAPFFTILLTGFAVHLAEHRPLRPSKFRIGIALLLTVCLYPATVQQRTGFELQFEQNGYSGIRTYKAVCLLQDISKDLNAESLPPQTVYLERDSRDFGYTSRGRGAHRRIRFPEYGFRFGETGDFIAQISYDDYRKAANLSRYAAHTVALYPHTGFIASFDGGSELPLFDDTSTLFTLTYSTDDHMLRRSVHPLEHEMPELTLILVRGGETIGRINAKNRTEQYFSAGLQTRAWLEMYCDGQPVRVSNIIQF